VVNNYKINIILKLLFNNKKSYKYIINFNKYYLQNMDSEIKISKTTSISTKNKDLNNDGLISTSKTSGCASTLSKKINNVFERLDNEFENFKSKTKLNFMQAKEFYKKIKENAFKYTANTSFYNNDDDVRNCKAHRLESEKCIKRTNSSNNSNIKKLKIIRGKTLKFKKQIKEQLQEDAESTLEKGVFFELEPNPNTRDYMEDFINIVPNSEIETLFKEKDHRLYILSDGHSGAFSAKTICENFPSLFVNCLNKAKDMSYENVVEKAIIDCFPEMDDELSNEEPFSNKEDMDNSGACTNLIYLCYEDGKRVVHSGNVGDSRSILVQYDKVIRLTYDHKAIDKEEQKRVKEEGGLFIRKRLYGSLAITRSLGDFEFKEGAPCLSNDPYYSRHEIQDTDRYIVIASDGVWDVINDSDVLEIIKSNDFNSEDTITNKPKNLATYLVKKALSLGSKDNISCIAIKLN